jgi:hypothetical protein
LGFSAGSKSAMIFWVGWPEMTISSALRSAISLIIEMDSEQRGGD